jgi:hypothetical protein
MTAANITGTPSQKAAQIAQFREGLPPLAALTDRQSVAALRRDIGHALTRPDGEIKRALEAFERTLEKEIERRS